MGKHKSLEEWKEDLVGKVFNRLTVLDIQPYIRKSTGKRDGYKAVCVCSCGNIIEIPTSSLVRGLTKSCGCLNLETKRETIKKARAYLKDHPEGYYKNKESSIQALKKWAEDHPEEVKKKIDKMHKWHKEHPEESKVIREKGKKGLLKWREDHPEEALSISMRALEQAHKWRIENPEKAKEITDNLVAWGRNNKTKHLMLMGDMLRNRISVEEKDVYEYLISLGYFVEKQYLLDGHYYDFKINNFLIEYNGSVYHYTVYENLNNLKAKEPPIQKKEKYYHVNLRKIALRNGFNLIQIWDYDWFNKKEWVKHLIKDQLDGIANYRYYLEEGQLNNDYGFNVDGEQIEPKGIWISTWYRDIVNESYSKGKVLVYNSGYTRIDNYVV